MPEIEAMGQFFIFFLDHASGPQDPNDRLPLNLAFKVTFPLSPVSDKASL
jgi:hypothetical protein